MKTENEEVLEGRRFYMEHQEYFDQHAEAKDGINKAGFAFHTERNEPGGHYFLSSLRESACHWCGRTREDVRYDDLPGPCENHQYPPDIKGIITGEEQRYFNLLKKGKEFIPKFISKYGMSGESLAVLHNTHGYDIETVGGIVEVPRDMVSEYDAVMERERSKSRACQVKKLIHVEIME